MKVNIEHISFQEGDDFLDATLHVGEGWVELKIDNDSFPISSQEDLDTIYKRLTELLNSMKE
jgi:hypothetical protein